MLARETDIVHVTGPRGCAFAHRATHFRGHDDLVAGDNGILYSLAQNLFRAAVGIDISGVEKVNSRFQTTHDHGVRAGLIHHRDVEEVLAKGHRAQTELGDFQASAAKDSIVHGSIVVSKSRLVNRELRALRNPDAYPDEFRGGAGCAWVPGRNRGRPVVTRPTTLG